jgi:hypothetical protein
MIVKNIQREKHIVSTKFYPIFIMDLHNKSPNLFVFGISFFVYYRFLKLSSLFSYNFLSSNYLFLYLFVIKSIEIRSCYLKKSHVYHLVKIERLEKENFASIVQSKNHLKGPLVSV